jgi:hypothetical protein
MRVARIDNAKCELEVIHNALENGEGVKRENL